MNIDISSSPQVLIGDKPYPYSRPWDGEPLTGSGFLAFDTETEMIADDGSVPQLALASASAGSWANCIIYPEQVADFILAHPHAIFVVHNAAFDFWVVDRHLRDAGQEDARRAWWDACDENRMRDTMLLDQLLELARPDANPRPRDL